ncbi:MAG: ureidoglycolate hydrolase, partial [Paraburkholderia sp.]
MSQKIDYLNPALPPGLRRVSMPVVDATATTLDGFGRLVTDPSECSIEIVQWPAVGTRPIDPGTGDEAGTTEGTFVSEWRGDILYGRNEAVGGNYILAYAREPEAARDDNA